jgi:hypothetical protein
MTLDKPKRTRKYLDSVHCNGSCKRNVRGGIIASWAFTAGLQSAALTLMTVSSPGAASGWASPLTWRTPTVRRKNFSRLVDPRNYFAPAIHPQSLPIQTVTVAAPEKPLPATKRDSRKDIPLLSVPKKKPRAKNINARMTEYVEKIGVTKAVKITKNEWAEILRCSPSGAQRVLKYRELREEEKRLRSARGYSGGIYSTPLGDAEVTPEQMEFLQESDKKFTHDTNYERSERYGWQKCGGGRRKKRKES